MEFRFYRFYSFRGTTLDLHATNYFVEKADTNEASDSPKRTKQDISNLVETPSRGFRTRNHYHGERCYWKRDL